MTLSGKFGMIVTISAAALLGCDEGLGPEPTPTGSFAGLLTYSHWPPADSLKDLRLVAVRTYPPANIVADALSGNAFVYPPIGDTSLVPFFVDSLRYIVTLPTGRYPYVVVAQQFGPGLYTDWRAVGQYVSDSSRTNPAPLDISVNDTLWNINIRVDFAHLPPQPF